MKASVSDYLEGNPEAQASRERYRDVVKALGEEYGRFVVRLEVKVQEDGGCVIIATSSRGQDCDEDVCRLAIAMIQSLTGVTAKPSDAEDAEDPEVPR